MRKLTKYEAVTLILRKLSNEVDMTDAEAISMSEYFPAWGNIMGLPIRRGYKFIHDGKLYEVGDACPTGVFTPEMEPSESTAGYYRYIPEEVGPESETNAPNKFERLAALENQLAGIVSAYREGVNEA